MILIVLKIDIRPDKREEWLKGVGRYTEAVRNEAGGPEFECFESLEQLNHFSVVEAFESRAASDGHTQTDHFKEFIAWFPGMIASPPSIINVEVDGWSLMSELAQ